MYTTEDAEGWGPSYQIRSWSNRCLRSVHCSEGEGRVVQSWERSGRLHLPNSRVGLARLVIYKNKFDRFTVLFKLYFSND